MTQKWAPLSMPNLQRRLAAAFELTQQSVQSQWVHPESAQEPHFAAEQQWHLSLPLLSIPRVADGVPANYLLVWLQTSQVNGELHGVQFQLFLPETLRNYTHPHPATDTFVNIPLGFAELNQEIMVIVVRFPRQPDMQRLLSDLDSLVQAMNATTLDVARAGLSAAVVDRLELIAAWPATEVVITGTTSISISTTPSDHSSPFFAALVPSAQATTLTFDQNQLRHQDGAQKVTGSHLVVRSGPPIRHENIRRTIAELRQRHLSRRADIESDEESGESYLSYLNKAQKQRYEAILQSTYGHHRGKIPVVTPIAVEIASDLIPAFESDTGDLDENFSELVNMMRSEIYDTFGVRIPGVRVRGNEGDLPLGSYIFMLDETPLLMGNAEIDKLFCLATPFQMEALGVETRQTTDPVTGREGMWLEQTAVSLFDMDGLVVFSTQEFVARHLRTLILNNLRQFVGTQEIANEAEISFPGRLYELEQSPGGLARFSQSLTPLLEEQLPIRPLSELATYYLAQTEGETPYLHQISEGYRRLEPIRSYLFSDVDRWYLLNIDDNFKALLRENLHFSGDSAALAILPEPTQAALAAVRDTVTNLDLGEEDIVLVLLADRAVRPFLKQLVVLEFPHLHVVATDELSAMGMQLNPAKTIHLEPES